MQPQRREVPVENDEYEREQQRLAKQVRRVVVLRNDLILAFCTVQKRVHLLELFQRNTYALPSFLQASKARCRLEKRSYPRVLYGSKTRSPSRTLST